MANDVKCDLSNFVFSDVCNNFAESHNDVTADTSIRRDDVNSDELAYTQLIEQLNGETVNVYAADHASRLKYVHFEKFFS